LFVISEPRADLKQLNSPGNFAETLQGSG